MDADTTLIVEVLGSVGGFSLLMLYVAARILSVRGASSEALVDEPRPLVPREGPFIAMPGHLTSREEMVQWMTTDLPKLTARMVESNRP